VKDVVADLRSEIASALLRLRALDDAAATAGRGPASG
jgi:hypothetical protein